MRFMDEVEIGDACTVADLQTGKIHTGKVIAKHDASRKVDVEYSSGRQVRVGVGFVSLLDKADV